MTLTLQRGHCRNHHKLVTFMSLFFSAFLVGNKRMMTHDLNVFHCSSFIL